MFEVPQEKPELTTEDKAVSVDVGLTPSIAITSDGSKYDNPKFLKLA
ncbi:hypothetical protein [Dapis sp. BLCC M229]